MPPGAAAGAPDAAPSPDPAAPAAPGPDAAALDARVADLTERLVRARADYDNLQKRVAREGQAERERIKARLLEGFLPLLELCHMAARQAEHHPGPISEGMVMLAREFDRLAQREGLVPVGAVGDAFDAGRHEVVAEEPAEGVAPGRVSRVVQPGYLLGDRVLRYAKVCVAPADGSAQ